MAHLALLTAAVLAAGPAVPAPAPAVHVGNPYAGAVVYRDPGWGARAAAEPGGERVAGQPTAVWLESAGDVAGLRTHLDRALAQRAGVVQLVLHDLPGRDCDRLFSEGELGVSEVGRYRTEFVDPLAETLADPAYARLRIVTLIEPRALANLVVNTTPQPAATFACDTMRANGGYVTGIRYALNRLHPLPNVYTYLDVADHWQTGRDDAVTRLITETVRGTTAGLPSVDGFVTNVAGYAPLREPYLTADDETRQSRWIAGNRFTDELSFARALRAELVAAGFPPGIGMLIDTSRNGWGGPQRPSAPSTDPDADARVDASRVDRRAHPNNWCNQAGAGLGERPRAHPAPGVDAYVWAQPPGESDGSAGPAPTRGFDRMCDPLYGGNTANGFHPTTALPGGPDRGEWFSAQFQQLMANAWPPLPPQQAMP